MRHLGSVQGKTNHPINNTKISSMKLLNKKIERRWTEEIKYGYDLLPLECSQIFGVSSYQKKAALFGFPVYKLVRFPIIWPFPLQTATRVRFKIKITAVFLFYIWYFIIFYILFIIFIFFFLLTLYFNNIYLGCFI